VVRAAVHRARHVLERARAECAEVAGVRAATQALLRSGGHVGARRRELQSVPLESRDALGVSAGFGVLSCVVAGAGSLTERRPYGVCGQRRERALWPLSEEYGRHQSIVLVLAMNMRSGEWE